jgi:uncharacterized protein
MMFQSSGSYATPHGSRYLQQLCKHFAHKTEVSFDATSGQVALRSGPAILRADAQGLTVTVSAPDAEALPGAQFAIDKHLAIFAHREGFAKMTWAVPVPV